MSLKLGVKSNPGGGSTRCMFGPFPPGWSNTEFQSRPAVFCKLKLANPVIRRAAVKEPHLCLMLFTEGGFQVVLNIHPPPGGLCPLALLVLMCKV